MGKLIVSIFGVGDGAGSSPVVFLRGTNERVECRAVKPALKLKMSMRYDTSYAGSCLNILITRQHFPTIINDARATQ